MWSTELYTVRRSEDFKRELKQKSAGAGVEIEEALKAIAARPHKPRPEQDYPVKEIRTSAKVTELHIAVTVYRLKIKKTGLSVTYTVRAFEKTVMMEDIDESWRSQLGIHPE